MKKVILFGLAAVMMAACEKPIMDGVDGNDNNADNNVILTFSPALTELNAKEIFVDE